MKRDFENELANDPRSVLEALSDANPHTRAQTIAMLQKHGIYDDRFVDAVSRLVGDAGPGVFGLTVGDVTEGYLASKKTRRSG